MPPMVLRNTTYNRTKFQLSKPLEDSEKDVMRPPSCSSSSDEENPGDIEPVVFNRNTRRDEKGTQNFEANRKIHIASSQVNNSYGGVNSYRLRRRLNTSSQINNSMALENGDDMELPELPRQPFENAVETKIPGKKTYRAVYGKMSQSSSQSTAYSQPNSSQMSQSSPKKKLKCIKLPSSDSDESEDQIYAAFKPPNDEFKLFSSDFDETEDESAIAFKPPSDELLNSSCFGELESKSLKKAITTPVYSSSCSSSPVSKRKKTFCPSATIIKVESSLPTFNMPKLYHQTPPSSLSDPCSSFGVLTQNSEKGSNNENTEVLFKEYGDIDFEKGIFASADVVSLGLSKENSDYQTKEYPSIVATSRCPMCYEPVSPKDLFTHGYMNTRQQEQFCLEHRKKSARRRWEINRYPNIDWDSLDARISKHHKFLQKLINGKESHYRSLLQAKIDKGKDRNLHTTTTNLIPGYYGPRGLRTISENLFRKFTPLLKKRIVQDRLIAARGYTPYVQSVLVPEVASLLIQEDMKITLVEARDVMAESALVGELLHEEVREDLISPHYHKRSILEVD